MFGGLLRRNPSLDLQGVDDVDLDAPIDTGAEDEVRALLFETPISIVDRQVDYLETTDPRVRRRPPRVPQRRPMSLVWLGVPVVLGLVAAAMSTIVAAVVWFT